MHFAEKLGDGIEVVRRDAAGDQIEVPSSNGSASALA